MTKEEILALIDAKIAGQGTNIDAGSALPEILSGIFDLIPDDGGGVQFVNVTSFEDFGHALLSEACTKLGISEEQFRTLFDTTKQIVLVGPGGVFLTRTYVTYEPKTSPGDFQGDVIFGALGNSIGGRYEIQVISTQEINSHFGKI